MPERLHQRKWRLATVFKVRPHLTGLPARMVRPQAGGSTMSAVPGHIQRGYSREVSMQPPDW